MPKISIKQHHNKNTKSRSYVPGEKIWLNGKYINIKQNQKLETKIFRSFRLLYLMGK